MEEYPALVKFHHSLDENLQFLYLYPEELLQPIYQDVLQYNAWQQQNHRPLSRNSLVRQLKANADSMVVPYELENHKWLDRHVDDIYP